MGTSKTKVAGVGINDADYSIAYYVEKDGKRIQKLCPYYNRWKSMIRRCYDEKYEQKRHNYSDVLVCPEWHLFSNFKSWMEIQIWDGLHLDKDILVKDAKIYSPTTCAFVPAKINTILGNTKTENEAGFTGVTIEKRYKALSYRAHVGHDRAGLGSYKTPQEAHKAWQWGKATQIESIIEWYATQDCFRTDVAEALTQRVWKLRLEHSLNCETKSV